MPRPYRRTEANGSPEKRRKRWGGPQCDLPLARKEKHLTEKKSTAEKRPGHCAPEKSKKDEKKKIRQSRRPHSRRAEEKGIPQRGLSLREERVEKCRIEVGWGEEGQWENSQAGRAKRGIPFRRFGKGGTCRRGQEPNRGTKEKRQYLGGWEWVEQLDRKKRHLGGLIGEGEVAC